MDPDEIETQRVRRIYDRRGAALVDREGPRRVADARAWVASRAAGDTLEIGIGRGLTLAHYAPTVRLTGIDVSPVLLAAARRRAADLGRVVTLREGSAGAIDAPRRKLRFGRLLLRAVHGSR